MGAFERRAKEEKGKMTSWEKQPLLIIKNKVTHKPASETFCLDKATKGKQANLLVSVRLAYCLCCIVGNKARKTTEGPTGILSTRQSADDEVIVKIQ